MADELIDVYDENNNPLNLTKKRSEVHREGDWHCSAHVWLYNFKGEILLQLRAKEKDFAPSGIAYHPATDHFFVIASVYGITGIVFRLFFYNWMKRTIENNIIRKALK